MIMSYADCCASSNRNASSRYIKPQRPNFQQLERYDRCTSENCMFCRESTRTDHLPASGLSQEIRKIPYRVMCRAIGAANDEAQISDDKSFIENGFKVEDFAGYYINGFNECIKQLVIQPNKMKAAAEQAIVEIQDCAQQTDEPSTAISTLRAKDPYYLSINSMIFGDYGQAIPKWKTKEFCAAAENFALFGRMHDEGGDGDSKLRLPKPIEKVKAESVQGQTKYLRQQQATGPKFQRFAPMFAPLVSMPPPMHPAPNISYAQTIPFGLPRVLPKHTAGGVYYQVPVPYHSYSQLKALEDSDKKQAKASVRCKSVKRK